MSDDVNIDDVLADDAAASGLFTRIMDAATAKIDSQYDKGRLTGAEYAGVYLGIIQTAMQQSVSFALGVHTANAQVNLIEQQTLTEVQKTAEATINVTAATAKKLLLDEDLNSALAKTQLITNQNLTEIQNTLFTIQKTNAMTAEAALTSQKVTTEVQNTLLVTANKNNVISTTTLTDLKAITEGANNLRVLQEIQKLVQDTAYVGAQKLLVDAKVVTEGLVQTKTTNESALLGQKKLTEEAQIVDRVTGALADVTGTVGRLKALQTAQTNGFARDAEQRLLRILMDAWNVEASTSAIPPARPDGATNVDIKTIISKAREGIAVAALP